jgi:hypothetical protein
MKTLSQAEVESLFDTLAKRYKLNEQAKLWCLAMLANALEPERHSLKPEMTPGLYNISASRMLFQASPTMPLHQFISQMADLCEQIPMPHFRDATILMDENQLKIAYEVKP